MITKVVFVLVAVIATVLSLAGCNSCGGNCRSSGSLPGAPGAFQSTAAERPMPAPPATMNPVSASNATSGGSGPSCH